jgi:hypothetical protein
MQVTRKKQICATFDELSDRHSCPANDVAFVMTLGHIEWMMSDDDLCYRRVQRAKPVSEPDNLLPVDPSAFDGERPSGVDSKDGYLFIGIGRMSVARNIAPILIEWPNKAEQNVVQRDIVIARHHNEGPWQLTQKGARRLELANTRPLCKITRDRHDVGVEGVNCLNKRVDDGFVNTAKVDIGQVDERSHV